MITEVIEVGNKIDITEEGSKKNAITDERRPINKGRTIYKSKVYDILDDDRLKIAMPFSGPGVVVLPLNSKYNMCFYTKEGLYQCVGHIVDRYKSDNQYVLIVVLKSGLQKVQRREFFRLEKLMDIEYRLLTEAESELESVAEILRNEQNEKLEDEYAKGIIVDLSGGGTRFVSDEKCGESAYVIIRLTISVNSKVTNLHVIGKIVLSERIINRPDKYENRIEFVRIQEQEREKLIQYIFEEERKIRQKERRP